MMFPTHWAILWTSTLCADSSQTTDYPPMASRRTRRDDQQHQRINDEQKESERQQCERKCEDDENRADDGIGESKK